MSTLALDASRLVSQVHVTRNTAPTELRVDAAHDANSGPRASAETAQLVDLHVSVTRAANHVLQHLLLATIGLNVLCTGPLNDRGDLGFSSAVVFFASCPFSFKPVANVGRNRFCAW